MNTPNPLVPQGATPSKATSSIGFKILMILSIHVVVIGGLLMQGCSKDKAAANKDADTTTAANTSPMSATPDFTPAGAASNNLATTTVLSSNTPAPIVPLSTTPAPIATTMTPAPMSTIPSAPIAPVAAPVGETHEYTIVAGDTLAVIAKHNGTTVKAILEANAGLDPKKLRPNHKIQIPAGKEVASSSSKSSSASTSDLASAPAGDGTTATYTVKSGDRLIKIASAHGTTVTKLLAMNDMKTTAIRAGQKIKVPVMKVASADIAPAPAVTPVSAPSAGTTAPLPATAAN